MISVRHTSHKLRRTFPGQSRHFTRHSCSPVGAVRGQISNLSSGYFAFIAACASISECGGNSYEISAIKKEVTIDLFHAPRMGVLVISADQSVQEAEGERHLSPAAAWVYSNETSSDQCRLTSFSESKETLMHSNYQTKQVKPAAQNHWHDDVQPQTVRVVVPQLLVVLCWASQAPVPPQAWALLGRRLTCLLRVQQRHPSSWGRSLIYRFRCAS